MSRFVKLNRGSFDAFIRAYSVPAIPADEVALMVSYAIRLKLNQVSAAPQMSDQAKRDMEAAGGRAIRQLTAESCELELTEEEYQLAVERFREGRKSFTGWMEQEVAEAHMALRDARKVEAPALVKDAKEA